ncbi:MAG TPA: competence/damage-inducible protein A [Actinomycetota bacterium]|nr:competence/damage-inducible protein A [Actinomycetota bacterium]
MRAEIVAVGTELLLGQIANTNARWMSEELAAIGVDVLHHQVVGDNVDRVAEALALAASRADVVLVSGGLGPTQDDLTREAIARVAGVPLERHPELEAMLREKFRGFSGSAMPANNLQQADVPRGARYLTPERGTAPGLVVELAGGVTLYAMAGVPAEMVEIMERTVLPELAGRSGAAIVSRVLRVTGMGESAVAERLAELFEASTNPTVAFLATGGEVKVRLTAKGTTAEEAGRALEPLVAETVGRLGDVVFSTWNESLEETVIRLLGEAGRTIATAESLTGGGVSARLTSVPGASATVRGSIVAYTEAVKRDVLGVSAGTLAGPGVVSEACAREMAAGARRVLGADVALALTGVAGPEPHGGHEPGLIWIALETPDRAHARGFRVSGARDRVVRWAQQAGLDLVRRALDGSALPVSSTTI